MTEESKRFLEIYKVLSEEERSVLGEIIKMAQEQPERFRTICERVKSGEPIEGVRK